MEHFSRYGLPADDEDIEGSDAVSVGGGEVVCCCFLCGHGGVLRMAKAVQSLMLHAHSRIAHIGVQEPKEGLVTSDDSEMSQLRGFGMRSRPGEQAQQQKRQRSQQAQQQEGGSGDGEIQEEHSQEYSMRDQAQDMEEGEAVCGV